MKIRRIAFLLLMLLPLLSHAQEENDSIKTYNLDEVVVEGAKQYAIENGIACIPTKKAKQHSMNAIDLISKMMVSGLRVDMISNKVETSYRQEVKFFIDGVEAQDWEVNALKPKDVQRIEFLQSPADPKFMNARAVVNFIMAKYKYGGYVITEASQSFINNAGTYNGILKVNHKKWTHQALAQVYYRNADGIKNSQNTDYTFSPDEVVNRVSISKQEEHRQMFTGAFNTRYSSEKLNLSISAGYRYSHKPLDKSMNEVTFTLDGVSESYAGESEYTSKSVLPYMSTYFQFSELPNNSYLYGAASLSYNHNDASGIYTLDKPIYNASKEDVWLPGFWLSYMFPLYKQNYMTVTTKWTSEFYRTKYSGTENSLQKLFNNYLYFAVRYNHTFSDKWNLGGSLEIPVNTYKVNDDKRKTTPFINGSLTLNGKINSKNSLYLNARIQQGNINPSYYNSAVRQDNEIEGIKGNADLKTDRYIFSVLNYSWMPVNKFSLNVALKWDQIINDIVPNWYPQNGLLVKDMVNSGNYKTYSATVTPSLSLFESKVNVQLMLYYARELHGGLVDLSFNSYGLAPYLSYMINSHFSVSASYSKFTKGYMRGSSNLSEFSDNLKMTAQYNTGNFQVQISVNSLNKKRGYVKSWFESPHYDNHQYTSRPWDGRYVNLKLRYTFDFGRTVKRSNDPQFEGSSKSSVL